MMNSITKKQTKFINEFFQKNIRRRIQRFFYLENNVQHQRFEQ